MTGKLDAPASMPFTVHRSNERFFRSTSGACPQIIKPVSNSNREYSLPDVLSTFIDKICPCTEKDYLCSNLMQKL